MSLQFIDGFQVIFRARMDGFVSGALILFRADLIGRVVRVRESCGVVMVAVLLQLAFRVDESGGKQFDVLLPVAGIL